MVDRQNLSESLADPLTERELEILHMVANGLTNQEIADKLFLSLDTIKWHNKQSYQKLRVNNRTQAVARARELRLLDSQNRPNKPTEPLSKREYEILSCLAEGLSNREIAHRMSLALRTIKWYNSQLYSKLAVSNRREAVEAAQRLGLLDVGDDPLNEGLARNNLPHQTTPFIGRHQELAELAQLIGDPQTRLVTILAPGGMGKTRLAQMAAENQLPHVSDGVYFVSLAPLSAASAIVTTIAETIGFSFYGEKSPKNQLIEFLSVRSLLLVLDNFEHLLNGAPLIADILQSAPAVCILATSRERLNLRGETVYILSGLTFPTWETPEDALGYDAVQLFMQSAQRVRADFTLQPDDLDFLARICGLTEGMPLGIELAAGWVDVLSLEQIAAEIQKGIDILETELRDVPERHRSIRVTFERTWDRLSDDEQATFEKLSVFRDGFSLPAAQAVSGASAQDLRGLARKALVKFENNERFTIHELLLQFGASKLAETGELLMIQARHAAFFADFMADRKQEIKTDRQLEALELIDLDFENVRTAWLYMARHQQWERLPDFLHSLWFYCDLHTRGQEAIEMLEKAVQAVRAAPSSPAIDLALARVLAPLGWFYSHTGFTKKGAVTCDEAIHILRQHDSPEDLIAALFNRQNTAFNLFQPDVAVKMAEEGVRIAQSINDKYWEGHLLLWAGAGPQTGVEVSFGNTYQFTKRALAIFEELDNRWGIMHATRVLGQAYQNEQQYTHARRCFEQALLIAERFGHSFYIAMIHRQLAWVDQVEHDYPTADWRLRMALKVYWDVGYTWMLPYPLQGLATLYAEQQDFERAVSMLATIHPHPLTFNRTTQRVQALREELEERLEPARFAAAWKHGQERTLSTLVAELLAELADSQPN